MSVQLSPASNPDGEECLSLSNVFWANMTREVEGIEPWNHYHDSRKYTPDQLRKIAAKHPEESKALEWLASEGGAVLS